MNNLTTTASSTAVTRIEGGFFYFPKTASVRDIYRSIPAATQSEINDAILPMIAGMPSRDQGEVGMMLAAQGYEIAVEGSPQFAIKAAVRAYMRNEVKDQHPTFRPSPPAFITEVKRQIFLRVRREAKAEPVEQIDRPTEADRAARVEKVRKLLARTTTENAA